MALVVGVSAGLLWGAERGRRLSRPAGKKAAKATAKSSAAKPIPNLPPAPENAPSAGVEIVSPQSEAKLRGVAVITANSPNASGYIVYRVDGEFAYATTVPFTMRWDTSTTSDGSHVVRADAYDSSGKFTGSNSIKVIVENAIPTPESGVLLSVKFGAHDVLSRQVTGHGELAALQADQLLPEGFDALSGDFKGELNQTVLDASYEGVSALVRDRLRSASLTTEGARQSIPEIGQYAMVQVSRNGLTIPASTATTRQRIGMGEISFALADYPVMPGDTWQSPLGVVPELYKRQAIFVQATHKFEGLRWFRGRECAVITSTYQIPEIPLYGQGTQGRQQGQGRQGQGRQQGRQRQRQTGAAGLGDMAYQTRLTGGGMRGGMRGGMGGMGGGMGGMRGGGMGGGGGMRGGMRGGGAQAGPGRQGGAGGQAAGPTRAPLSSLNSARLTEIEGQRTTFITRGTGRVMRVEDIVRGKVEFRAAVATQRTGATQRTAAISSDGYSMQLTGMMGGGMQGGMRGGGMQGGMRGGGGMQGGMRGGGAGRQGGGAAPGGGGAAAAKQIPSTLDYALRLVTDLAVR
jgi:hypothetical protein